VSAALPIRRVEKPWGRDRLPEPFATPDDGCIGEIWFEPPPELERLLVKYIFTSEKLSVQVHPSERQLPGQGKEECWLVIDAEPGARLGIGFRQAIGAARMRQAALDGSIEELLEWHEVRAGDFFYIPAGTVHAIGAGISLIEVQQNSDVTYRLFDYGRPRALHLDDAVAVARGEPYPPALRSVVPEQGAVALVDGPWFRLDQVMGRPDGAAAARYPGPLLVIPRDGAVRIAGEELRPGDCGLALRLSDVDIAAGHICIIASACSS